MVRLGSPQAEQPLVLSFAEGSARTERGMMLAFSLEHSREMLKKLFDRTTKQAIY
jgi:hypothetical protein